MLLLNRQPRYGSVNLMTGYRLAFAKVLSATVVSLFVLSSLLGVIAVAPIAAAEEVGDLTINGTTFLIGGESTRTTYKIDGDLKVVNGGKLTINNADIIFVSDKYNQHSITVNGTNSKLIMINANITTAYPDGFHNVKPWPLMNMTVENGAYVNMTDGSELRFPGNLNITGSSTKMVMWDSALMKLTSLANLDTTVIASDYVDDGPAISIDDSTFEMYDSAIPYLPTGVNHANITLTGIANFTAVNSYISADYLTTVTTHNIISLSEHANAYLYGCVLEGVATSPADSAIHGETVYGHPVATAKLKDNTGQTISDTYSVNMIPYVVSANQYLGLKNFTMPTTFPNYDILAVQLTLVYQVDSAYVGSAPIYFRLTSSGTNVTTGVIPVRNENRNVTIDLLSHGVDTRNEINQSLIISFRGGSAGTVQFDAIYLNVTVGPQAYVYRWADINVTDAYGIPLSGASISAKFNNSDWQNDKAIFYYVPGTTQTTSANPPANILYYLGKDSTSYKTTDGMGTACIPYLTDIVYGNSAYPWNLNGWPNSQSVGSINVTATKDAYKCSFMPSYSPYPQMTEDDAAYSASSVSIAGASATTWDNSKYLVVPTNQTLIGEYTHFGDVIVKNWGVLTIKDAFNVFHQNPSTFAKITVYSGGTLNLIGATLNCVNKILYLEVKSGGTLTITNSTIGENIGIVAHGNAAIEISGSSIDGMLILDSDATMTTEISNTSFVNPPTFGGSSVVTIVNVTSLLGFTQEDNSKVILMRFALITVNDMTELPLAGATVKARYQLDPSTTARATGTSDSNGQVLFKLLVCRMNCSGGSVTTTYFGNYQFNASYNLPPVKNATEKTLSFATYPDLDSESNTLEQTLAIPVTFADLTFGSLGVYTVPAPPRAGTSTVVHAQVWNIGSAVVIPFNVTFYYNGLFDSAHRLGIFNISSLASGAIADSYVSWPSPPTGITSICALINRGTPLHAVSERDYSNNGYNLTVGADLYLNDVYVVYNDEQYLSGVGSIPSDREVEFHITFQNTGSTDISTPVAVILFKGNVSAANRTASTNISSTISMGEVVPVVLHVTLPLINVSYVKYVYTAVVNPTTGQGGYTWPISEIDMSNNAKSFDLNVTDSRPDPSISAANIAIYMNTNTELRTVGNNISYATDLRIVATIVNLGYNPVEQVSVSLDINGTTPDATIGEDMAGGNVKYVDLNGSEDATGSWTVVEWAYKVTVRYAGEYKINITLNKENASMVDKNTTNNNAFRLINVTYITPVITLIEGAPPTNVTAGTTITITGEVKYPVTLSPMAGVAVTVQIQNGTGALVGLEGTATTSTGGIFSVQILVPGDTPAGEYKIVVTVGQTSTEVKQIHISSISTFDWLLIIIIIVIVAAVLAFTYYIYRQGVGKLVECGECGSLIPESAKKCPKCGVEFEEDMVKCSECGAWIAADSLECPNCHVKFGTPLEGEKTYEEKMLDQYELTVVAKYRDIAKGELGKSYTEETFQSWWEANPGYIAFEDWLVKEEARRKQSNIITCPVCGSPNPPGSQNCASCGSPLEGGKGGASTVVVEKRVIRQPVDRKVVPKKVIKKPLDEQGGQGGQQ